MFEAAPKQQLYQLRLVQPFYKKHLSSSVLDKPFDFFMAGWITSFPYKNTAHAEGNILSDRKEICTQELPQR